MIAVVVLLVKLVPAFFRGPAGGRQVADRRRYLPVIFLPLDWLLPPILILLRVGELEAQWVPLRATGFLLSVYAALMLLLGNGYARSVPGRRPCQAYVRTTRNTLKCLVVPEVGIEPTWPEGHAILSRSQPIGPTQRRSIRSRNL